MATPTGPRPHNWQVVPTVGAIGVLYMTRIAGGWLYRLDVMSGKVAEFTSTSITFVPEITLPKL